MAKSKNLEQLIYVVPSVESIEEFFHQALIRVAKEAARAMRVKK